MKKTLKQRNLELLQSIGWTVDTSTRVTKYTVLSKPGANYHYYLGNAGAVRRGRTVAESVSVKLDPSKIEAWTVAKDPEPAVNKEQDSMIVGGVETNTTIGPDAEDEQRPDPQPVSGTEETQRPKLSEHTNDGATVSSASTPLAKTLKNALDHERQNKSLVAGYSPTDEQRQILDAAAPAGLKCLVIQAGAGAGKTSTLKMLEEILPGRGQYTAFNKALVTESKSKFRKARCSTTHGLAFGTVGKLYSHRMEGRRIRSEQVASQLGIADMDLAVGHNPDGTPTERKLTAGYLAGQVMVAVRRFCQSADPAIAEQHFKRIDGIDADGVHEDGGRTYENNDLVRRYLLPFAQKAWADLSSTTGTLPFSHDVYVKVWQLGTGPNKPLIPADYILLDEGQDTAPVFLDVLKQQTHALLILVGDSNQAIYEWRGAVDAMQAFPDAPRRMLSQSFRFGPRIADVANSILAGLEDGTDLILKGLDSLASVVELDEPTVTRCVLTRTNAGALGALMEGRRNGKKTHLIASVDEVIAFVRAAQDLKDGKAVNHPDLGCFNAWPEVVEYSKTDEGQELRLWVKLIEEFGCGEIVAALDNQCKERDADLVVCTAHKSKGREWDSVQLAADFPPACRMSDSDRRLLYVAATRAKQFLDLSRCTPFHSYRDKETGEETPGLKIKWTGPMPTKEDQGKAVPSSFPAPVEAGKEENGAGKEEPQQDAPCTNGKATEFTWANYNGKWHVGGPDGHEGETVSVVRKNGTSSKERLGKVVKRFSERCIYATS